MIAGEPSPTPRGGTAEEEKTRVGNYFVANYPPFSFWSADHLPAADRVLGSPAPDGVPLGLYVHIPFCRKRCDFCYFKVYTDRNAREIERYLEAVVSELERYARHPYLAGRAPSFVYFGGGTPSYLSARQLGQLFDGIRRHVDLDGAKEVAFECEPGTLSEVKIETLRELGVTRLSMGVENFDPSILEANNRAHRAQEIYRTYAFARKVGFPQINLDLIAGMVGETDANWTDCIDKTVELGPDSVTIYQMEVPYNTTLHRRTKEGELETLPVADWGTKRRWIDEAFGRLEAEGYAIGSAYTAYRGDHVRFLYRDALWHGADLLGVGVASFSHLGGVHLQNEHAIEPYLQKVDAGETPVLRAFELTDEQRLIRELVLQMKLGRVGTEYFRGKFGVDVLERFREPLERHRDAGMLELGADEVRATREGLLRIDTLLADFFLEEHRGARYA